MLTVLTKKYLTNRVYVVNSNAGLGGNWSSEIIIINCQQWRTAKRQPTNNTEHVTQKQILGAQAPEVCEREHFPLFCSSAGGKYSFY